MSGRDLAVLIRQALRFESLKTAAPAVLDLPAKTPLPEEKLLQDSGLTAQRNSTAVMLRAEPWRPDWLPDVPTVGADAGPAGWALRELNVPKPKGDPFLSHFKMSSYASPGQRTAIRAAFTTPPGATLLVILPTGEGKSLLFQAIAEFGFGDEREFPSVTIVVTPTIALASDHERSARSLGLDDIPRAHIGGNDARNQEIAERIATGTQGLCFMSPEAFCGSMRWPIMQATRAGYLRSIVIDEAHLVDSWGTEFRSHYQMLSGLWRDLIEASPPPIFRTFLLSATVTSGAFSTLETLFGARPGEPSQFELAASARLRPEIEYWCAAESDETERERRVLDALLHLPRPAILYVTRISDGNDWYSRLRGMGFSRIALVTGQTPSREKERIVDAWANGQLDLVVGNSAFGLGINNVDVRTVVHACIPESLDRFYQEVGRGGRDSHASISVIIPAGNDVAIARDLNRTLTIGEDKGFRRWSSMFGDAQRKHLRENLHAVRLDIAPDPSPDYIDMVNDLSIEWNVRTLTLMARAGLISLEGSWQPPRLDAEIEPNSDARGSWQLIRVLVDGLLDKTRWSSAINTVRAAVSAENDRNLQAMLSYLRADRCISRLLVLLYSIERNSNGSVKVAAACGGCNACRHSGELCSPHAPSTTSYPWPARAPGLRLVDLVDDNGRLLVFYSASDIESPMDRRRVHEALAQLARHGVHNIKAFEGSAIDVAAIQERIGRAFPVFTSSRLAVDALPPGASLVVAPAVDGRLPVGLDPRVDSASVRIYLLPVGAIDPVRPGELLMDTFGGRKRTLRLFLEEVNR